MTRLVIAASMVAACAAPAFAQDPAKTYPKQYHGLIDNARVRVLHVVVAPGEKNALHDHPDHVAVTLGDTSARFTGPDGKSQDLVRKAGEAIYIGAGKHAGENIGKGKLEAIIVELKGNAAPTAGPAAPRPGLTSTPLIDNPRVRVSQGHGRPDVRRTGRDDARLRPGGDRWAGDVALTVDGTTTTMEAGRRHVHRPRLPARVKNTSGKAFEFVIVGIKRTGRRVAPAALRATCFRGTSIRPTYFEWGAYEGAASRITAPTTTRGKIDTPSHLLWSGIANRTSAWARIPNRGEIIVVTPPPG